MIKKILSYSVVEGVSKALNKGVLFSLPLLLITTEFGKVGILVTFELLFPVVLLLGLDRCVLRFHKDSEGDTPIIPTILTSVIAMHVLAAVLLLVGSWAGYDIFFGISVAPDMFLLIGLSLLQGIILINLNALRVEGNHKAYFTFRLLFQVLKFTLIFLLVFSSIGYLSYVIGGILAALVVMIFIYKKLKSDFKLSFNSNVFISLLGFSWPFVFHGVAGNILGNVDKLIIQAKLSTEDVGVYTFAYAVGSAIAFGFIGLSVYFEPLIYKEHDDKMRKNLLQSFLSVGLLIGLSLFLIISLVSVWVLPTFYSDNYSRSFELIPIIAAGHLFMPFYLISNYEFIYHKRTLNIAIISIVCSVINIALNLYLIPRLGIIAAAYTTIATYILMAIVFSAENYRFAKRIDFAATAKFAVMAVALFNFIYFEINVILFYLITAGAIIIMSRKPLKKLVTQ